MATGEGSLPPVSSTGGVDWQWRTRDFIVAAALAVPLGLIWSFAYGFVWLTARGIQPLLGDVFDGFYIIGGVLVAYIIRKPGAALLGEMLAALIEIPFTGFGAVVLWLGLLQGLGVELVFLATRYRRFDLLVLMLAGAMGALVAVIGYSYVTEGWLGPGAGLADPAHHSEAARRRVARRFAGQGHRRRARPDRCLNNFPIARGRDL